MTAIDENVAFVVLPALVDEDAIIISFKNAWHGRTISLCKLNLV